MSVTPDRLQAARLPSLTGLRFIAAFLVFALHVTYQSAYITGSVGDVLGRVFARSGFYGVSFFFVLSGFVLTWSVRPRDRTAGFWRRRLVKIYPNHLVTFGVTAVLMLFASEAFSFRGSLANLFLVQSWFPDIQISRSMNQVTWSLSCELFFYLCFPLLLWLVNKVPVRRLWVLAAVLAALIVTAPVLSQHVIGGTRLPFFPGGPLSFEQVWFVYLFPPVRGLEFVLGMVAARLVLAGAWPQIGLVPASLIAIGGYVVDLKLPYLFGIAGIAALWLTPLVAAAALADVRSMASPFRGRLMVRLGEVSFAFYMVHGLVVAYGYLWLIAGKQVSPLAGAGWVIAAFALSLALSFALFTWVEQPLVARFSTSRRQHRVLSRHWNKAFRSAGITVIARSSTNKEPSP